MDDELVQQLKEHLGDDFEVVMEMLQELDGLDSSKQKGVIRRIVEERADEKQGI